MQSQIILSSDETDGVSNVQAWLDFNEIKYQYQQFWDAELGAYNLPADVDHSILVCQLPVLENFVNVGSCIDHQIDKIKSFCRRENQLWIVGTDLGLRLVSKNRLQWMLKLDVESASRNIIFFLDATPTDRCYLSFLKNLQIRVLQSNHFDRTLPRYQSPTSSKAFCKYDYLLTMVRKSNRPHRDLLWHELKRRPMLLDKGLIALNHAHTTVQQWIGRQPFQNNWCGHAAMDLYLDCWLEIVPETCYKDLYFFTEKSQKPIMTRTPFLMVSTAGYLDWLHNRGFRTFDCLIDERYDRHYHIEDRVRHLVDLLEDIIRNGSEDFYHASKDILDHNFSRLCEIAGSWNWQFDQEMWPALENFQACHNGR